MNMKSEKTKELMTWLEKRVRKIDWPVDYSYDEVIDLIEIAELELLEDPTLSQKVKEFKTKRSYY